MKDDRCVVSNEVNKEDEVGVERQLLLKMMMVIIKIQLDLKNNCIVRDEVKEERENCWLRDEDDDEEDKYVGGNIGLLTNPIPSKGVETPPILSVFFR